LYRIIGSLIVLRISEHFLLILSSHVEFLIANNTLHCAKSDSEVYNIGIFHGYGLAVALPVFKPAGHPDKTSGHNLDTAMYPHEYKKLHGKPR
jgi:hypothetical protein